MSIKKTVKKLTPHFLLHFYHWAWAFFGALIFGFPGRKMKIIGVTGTSGKSTTVDFITRILEESGARVASLSSVRFKIADKEWKNNLKMTMPGRLTIQRFLKDAANAHCQYAVLEVTSEGIKQFRHKFINFDTVVFTNLSPEHIEAHGSFEKYRNEKLKLFLQNSGTHIINGDDENAEYFLKTPAEKIIKFNKNIGDIKLNLLGDFNFYNTAAAIAVAQNYKVSLEICKKALEKIQAVPGRMEIVAQKPLVVVDYAHTPEQLKQVYQSFGDKKLVCVLGSCGGGRDKWKRPVLGSLADQYCREIRKALELAKPEEVVIVTGKGSEPVMCLAGGRKIPWSDKKIVEELVGLDKKS